MLLTEAPEGGWACGATPHTNEELVAAARAEICACGKYRQRGNPMPMIPVYATAGRSRTAV